jgi:monoamine oxidase
LPEGYVVEKQFDAEVAIVGAGVSGVYCAWRLRRAYPDMTVVVFEGSDRIGGRLLSVQPPDIKDMVAELGGMRTLPAAQPLITRLIDVLNAEIGPTEQIETYPFPVDEPQNIFYLRGKWLRGSDFRIPSAVPYNLSFIEEGETPGSIIKNAIEQIVPGITSERSDARRRAMCGTTFADKPLNQQGFWNVLARVISGEAYQLGVDAGGYQSTLSNWNAADAIPWYLSDFGDDLKYRGFVRGFQQVPCTLATEFDRAGRDIRLGKRLDGFNFDRGGVRLCFGKETITAGALILAMPRRSLDLLAPKSPPLRLDKVRRWIESVTPHPLFKLFTTYDHPWWRAAGRRDADDKVVPVEAGRSVTDLPVRQTYYWPRNDGSPASAGPAMLMASYDDGTNVDYWEGLRPRRRQAWALHEEVAQPRDPFGESTDNDPGTWSRYRPETAMVDEVNRQLGLVHGLPFTPKVCHAAFRDWGDDPFGGGWNSWNIGVDSREVKCNIVQPHASEPLYICGEAYSDAQGWVEGALQTADAVLERFGVPKL